MHGNPLVGCGCHSRGSAAIATDSGLLSEILEVLEWNTENTIYSLKSSVSVVSFIFNLRRTYI